MDEQAAASAQVSQAEASTRNHVPPVEIVDDTKKIAVFTAPNDDEVPGVVLSNNKRHHFNTQLVIFLGNEFNIVNL